MALNTPFLLPQGDFNSFDTRALATSGLVYKTDGKIVYIISEDKFYYWKVSLLDWVALV